TGGDSFGVVTINSGTVQIGDNATSGVGFSGSVVNNATLAFNRPDSATYSGVISGGGIVNKTGSSTLTMNGNSSYTGTTNITAGKVIVTNNTALGTTGTGAGAVNVSGGAALDVAGVVAANGLNFGANKIFNVSGDGGGNGVLTNSGVTAQQ